MISESPLLHAIQVSNLGESNRTRKSYELNRTGVAKDWHILFQTEHIIVQDIP